MLKNLRKELGTREISTNQLARILEISEKTAHNKLYGKTEFKLSEIVKIRIVLPEYSFDYLFFDSDHNKSA